MSTSMSPGMKIGDRWRVTGLIGQGGFGQVYRCVDESHIGLGEAAVKVLHPNTTPQERNDFIREVKQIAQLRHQNLVGYLDSGFVTVGDEVHPYMVTELCRGSLDDRLRTGVDRQLTAGEATGVLLDVTAGLGHLHERGMIHRDIKPGNVLHGTSGWKLADFGLMRDLTTTGSYHRGDAIKGTPLFMAPELFTTMTTTAPSDIYAVGVLAHLCLAGRPVHTGTGSALIHAITTMPPSIDPGLDRRFRQLIGRAVHHDPGVRPTAWQFHQQLTAIDRVHVPRQAALTVPAPLQAVSSPPAVSTPPPPPLDPAVSASSAATNSWGGHDTSPTPAPAGRSSKRSHIPAVTAAVVAGLVLVFGGLVAAGVGFLATGDDGASASADGIQALADQGSDSNDESAISSSAEGGVVIDESVEIGDGAIIGDDPSDNDGGDAGTDDGVAASGVVPEPESHFDQEPCATGPGSWLMLTNRHDRPVDYVVLVDHLDAAGVTIDDNREIVRALTPGETTRIDIETSEEGAAGCRLVGVEAVETSVFGLSNLEHVVLDGCEADIAGHEITVTATNPLEGNADAEVYVAVIAEDGVRVDEDWAGIDIFDMSPGESVRATGRAVFWALDSLGQPPVQCRIVAVEFDPR